MFVSMYNVIKACHRTKMKWTISVKKKKKKKSEQNLFITHFKVGIIAVDFHEKKTMKTSHIVLFVPAHVS